MTYLDTSGSSPWSSQNIDNLQRSPKTDIILTYVYLMVMSEFCQYFDL